MNFTKQDFEKILAYINRRSAKDSSFPVLSEVSDGIDIPVLSNGSNRLLPLEMLIDYLSRNIDAARIPVDVSGLEGATLLDVLNELYVIAKTDNVIDPETGEGLVLPSEDITYTKSGFNFNDVKNALDTLFDLMSSKADDDDVTSAIGNISTALANKADLETTSRKVLYNQMPSVILRYIAKSTTDTEASHTISEGDVYYGSTGYLLLYTSSAPHSLGTPNKGLIYYCIEDGKYYKYDSRFSWTEIGVSDSDDGQGSGSPDLSTILGGDGKIRSALAPACVMYITDSVPNTTNVPVHSYYCLLSTRPQDVNIYYRDEVVTEYITQFNDILIGQPQTNVIYYDIVTDKFYRWQSSKFVNLTHNASLGNDGRVVPTQATAVVLKYIASVNNTNIPQLNTGDVYCDQSNMLYVKGSSYDSDIAPISHTSGNSITEVGSPDSHLIYYNVHTNGFYKWSGSAWDMIGSSGDGTITSIMMNGSVVPESEGTVNLGTVVTDISGKTDKASDSRLQSSQATAVILKYINGKITDDEGNESTEGDIDNPPLVGEGDVFFSGNHISVKVAGNSINLGEPDGSIIYYNLYTKKLYRWKGTDSGWGEVGVTVDSSGFVLKNDLVITTNGDKTTITLGQGKTAQVINQHQSLSSYATKSYVDQAVENATHGETVVTSVDDVVLVDGFNSNTVLAGATARSVKELYDNVMALRNALAGIAFKDSLPNWITVQQITYSMDTSGLTNFATPQTTSWVEGSEVTVVLSAATGYALNATVASSITVKDADDNDITLSQNPTFDSSTGTISFKIASINKNFVVTGTALQALSVSLQSNSGLTLSANGVVSGDTFSATISVADSSTHKLPATITTSDVSGTYGNVTYTRTSDASGTLEITNVTSDLTINVAAVAWGSYSISLSSTSGHISLQDANGNAISSVSENNNGASIKVVPDTANNYVLSAAPTVTMSGNGTYTVGAVAQDGSVTITFTKITGNVTIAAEAAIPQMFSVTMGGDTGNYTSDAMQNVQEGQSLNVTITPAEDCSISAVAVTMENNGTPVALDTSVDGNSITANQNGTYTVIIASVTGNVVINVTSANTNPDYKNVRQPEDMKICFVGDGVNYFMSKKLPLGNIAEGGSVVVAFNGNWDSSHSLAASLVWYDQNDKVLGYSYDSNSAGSSTVTISNTSASYVRLCGLVSNLSSSTVSFTDTNGVTRSWSGSGKNYNNFATWVDFVENCTNVLSDGTGNYRGAIQMNPTAVIGSNNDYFESSYAQTAESMKIKSKSGESDFTYTCGKLVSLSDAKYSDGGETKIRQLSFSAGTASVDAQKPYIKFYTFDANGRVSACASIKAGASTNTVTPDVSLTPTLFTYSESGAVTTSTSSTTMSLVEFTHAMIAYKNTNRGSVSIKYLDADGTTLHTLFDDAVTAG